MLNKKADGGITAILIIVIIIIFFCVIFNVNNRECNSNKDCNQDSYCGSDFSCHQHPVINTEVNKISTTLPIILICITLIILAVIFRWEKIFKRTSRKKETTKEKPKEESTEAYYTSQFQYSAK
jgi:uncharacterized membrane protein